VCAVNACIEIGTFCMLSVRRCAVTVISSSAPVAASVPPVAGSAAYAAQDEPPRMAATAYEIFEFIADPLDSMCTTAAPASPALRPEGAARPCGYSKTRARAASPLTARCGCRRRVEGDRP